MADADACCEPVLNLNEAVDSPLTQARSMVNSNPDGKTVPRVPPETVRSRPPHR